MILEKIKENSGKILFFAMNALMIVAAIFYVKQQKLHDALSVIPVTPKANDSDVPALSPATVQSLQEGISGDRQQKIDNIGNNPAVVVKKETVPVTKVIPGATRKVVVPVASSTSSTKSTTTKKSTPAKKTKSS
jgi:hypothetical protein